MIQAERNKFGLGKNSALYSLYYSSVDVVIQHGHAKLRINDFRNIYVWPYEKSYWTTNLSWVCFLFWILYPSQIVHSVENSRWKVYCFSTSRFGLIRKVNLYWSRDTLFTPTVCYLEEGGEGNGKRFLFWTCTLSYLTFKRGRPEAVEKQLRLQTHVLKPVEAATFVTDESMADEGALLWSVRWNENENLS